MRKKYIILYLFMLNNYDKFWNEIILETQT
jgi:hypothetical protein